LHAHYTPSLHDALPISGHHVALAPELRDPEAVDHVGALERELDGPAGGQVELVRRRDVERRVPELPPPLAAAHEHLERPGRGRRSEEHTSELQSRENLV